MQRVTHATLFCRLFGWLYCRKPATFFIVEKSAKMQVAVWVCRLGSPRVTAACGHVGRPREAAEMVSPPTSALSRPEFKPAKIIQPLMTQDLTESSCWRLHGNIRRSDQA